MALVLQRDPLRAPESDELPPAEPESKQDKIKRLRNMAGKPALTLNLGAANSNAPSTSQAQQGVGLFGSSQQQQQQPSMFGSNTQQSAQQGGGGSLFGASTQKPSLFGSTAQQPAQQGGGGLQFGASTQQQQQQQPTQGNSLFGGTQQNNTQGRGLFGNTQQQPQQGGSLFGNTQQQPQQQGGSLFGNTQQQPQQQGGSLFGNTQQQPQQGGSLFGNTQQQPQPQQQQGGLFGASTAQQQQQQQPAQSSLFGFLASRQSRPQDLGGSLWQTNMQPREKSIPEQILTVAQKWHPDSPNCLMQHHFYNAVNPATVPYFGPEPGEDEKKWEEALAKKPFPGSVPILARGFKAVGNRLEMSTNAVSMLQTRMHEINNALTKMMQNHELTVSVRIADARRRHAALSQRCLTLATKVQVLRNRGYALDRAEEALKQKLMQLEKDAFDPVLSGRQEEIWARLSDLRERALLLQEESGKLGTNGRPDDDEQLDEDTIKAIRKLLHDYDSQLGHLKNELESIKTDFEGWESDRAQPARGR